METKSVVTTTEENDSYAILGDVKNEKWVRKFNIKNLKATYRRIKHLQSKGKRFSAFNSTIISLDDVIYCFNGKFYLFYDDEFLSLDDEHLSLGKAINIRCPITTFEKCKYDIYLIDTLNILKKDILKKEVKYLVVAK